MIKILNKINNIKIIKHLFIFTSIRDYGLTDIHNQPSRPHIRGFQDTLAHYQD